MDAGEVERSLVRHYEEGEGVVSVEVREPQCVRAEGNRFDCVATLVVEDRPEYVEWAATCDEGECLFLPRGEDDADG